MAKKGSAGRVAPHPGGPSSGALSAATKKKKFGGWKNAKAAALTAPGATNLTTLGAGKGGSQYALGGGGGKTIKGRGPAGGSLAMTGRVRVKHPRSAASHFASARPAGGAARKVRKAKAPGK